MSIQELSPEELAKVFFHYQELLASDFGCSKGSRPHSWNEISHRERSHMVTAAKLALLEIGMAKGHNDLDRNRYFPKPGSAEWGC